MRNQFDISNVAKETVETVVDGDSQEIWPKCAAWFLGPKVDPMRRFNKKSNNTDFAG